MRQPDQPRKPQSLTPRNSERFESDAERSDLEPEIDARAPSEFDVETHEIADADIVEERPGIFAGLADKVRRFWPAPRVDNSDAGVIVDEEEDPSATSQVTNAPVYLSERRAEKRREERKFRVKRIGIGAAIVVSIIFIVWILFKSPIFQYSYDAADLVYEAPDGVVNHERAQQALAAHDGIQLLSLNPNELASALVDDVPEIKEVKISRDLPSSLTVTVYPHVPVACLGKADACDPVAEDGTKLRLGPTVTSRLPVVDVAGNDDVDASVDTALEVLGAIDQKTLASVNGLKVTNAGLVTLALTEGRSVFWGASEDNAFKAQVLKPLLTEPAKKYDISIPHSPVTN